jgi:hypothetical protein
MADVALNVWRFGVALVSSMCWLGVFITPNNPNSVGVEWAKTVLSTCAPNLAQYRPGAHRTIVNLAQQVTILIGLVYCRGPMAH